jgi:membrane protein implicated in regulation of membrane protease activity
MSKAKSERFSIALFNIAVAISALVMLWLLWHFPIVTVTSALIVVALVAVVASLTKSLDVQPAEDVSQPKPSA